MNEIKTGSYVGTGAAKNVIIGWVPTMIIVVNITDGDNAHLWFDTMADDTDINIVAAAGPVLNAAGGITPLDGSAGAGFTVGADLSENAKTFAFIAFRGTAPSDS